MKTSEADLTVNESESGEFLGFTLVLPVKPVPASRPRVTRWGTYYSKTYQTYKDAADAAIPVCPHDPLEGPLKAQIVFACHRPKSTKLISPRGDIDNHMKAILDAVVGPKKNPKGWIADDDCIDEVFAVKRYQEENEIPHTRISIQKL